MSDFFLKKDKKGIPFPTIDNFLSILEHDNNFKTLKFNLLSYSPEKEINGKTVKWKDSDDAETRRYIEKKYLIHSKDKLDDALRILFKKREYNPVHNKIESLEWDNVSRIKHFLSICLKVEDSEYSREVSRLIFAGGIHRIYSPGCKFDDVVVLVGTNQGEGKSTIVRWLALQDEFFAEVTELDGQKGIEAIEGAWICEISELLAMTRAKEVESIKSYMSKLVDRYRRPFDRRTSDHPRQCIFVGTTNKQQFLSDKTGNRRFYPVTVKSVGNELFENEKVIKEFILQCWAEALFLYKHDKLTPCSDFKLKDEIKKHQEGAREEDCHEGFIEDYLIDKKETCILEVFRNALNIQFAKPSRRESNDIALILSKLGWERTGKSCRTFEYGVQKIWAKTIN